MLRCTVSDFETFVVIVALAATTYLTRAGGLLIMSVVPVTPRTEAFLESLSSSVMVAIVMPALLTGDTGTIIGIAAVLAAMVTTRNIVIAMTAGVVVAALTRMTIGI